MSDAPDAVREDAPTEEPAPETPPEPKAALEAEAPSEPEAEAAPEAEPPKAKPDPKTASGAVKARPVTRKMLQAAARAPTDVVDILKAEANALKKRAERGQPPPRRERKHTASSVREAARALQAKHESEDDLPVHTDEPADVPPADVPPARPAAEARPAGEARPAARRAPSTPAAPARAASPPPAAQPSAPPAPAPTAAADRQPLLAGAVLAAGVLVAAAVALSAPRAPAPATTSPTPAPTAAPSPAPSAPTRAPTDPRQQPPGAVAELGDNRVLYTAGRGELVVLWRDPSSGELEVERVYQLSRDPGRDLGQTARRYHAWYIDDLHVTRRAALRKAHARYESMVDQARTLKLDITKAEEAAARLARLGGADRLVKYLQADAGAIHHRSATIGLAQAGYLCAVPHLLDLLRRHGDSPAFAKRLIGLLAALTELDLSREPGEVLKQVEAWRTANPLKDTYQRVE